jgi:hypothetical protein
MTTNNNLPDSRSDLKNKVDSGSLVAVPEGMMNEAIGFLVTFSVHHGEYPIAKYIEDCERLGIPENERCNANRYKDSYKQAVRELEEKGWEEIPGWGKCRVKYSVKDLNLKAEGDDGPVEKKNYSVMREIIGFPKNIDIADVEFDKKHSFRFTLDDEDEANPKIIVSSFEKTRSEKTKAEIDDMEKKINERFKNMLTFIDEDKMRRVIRDTIRYKFKGIPWSTSKGLYFVAKEFHEAILLHKVILTVFRDAYSPTKESEMRLVPLIDTREHREYILNDVKTELAYQLKSQLDDVVKKIASGKNIEAIVEAGKEVRKTISEHLTFYENIVGEKIEVKMTKDMQDTILSASKNRIAALQAANDMSVDVNKVTDGILDLLDLSDKPKERETCRAALLD